MKLIFSKLVREYRPNISSSSVSAYVSVLAKLFPAVSSEEDVEHALERDKLNTVLQMIEDKYKSPSSRALQYNAIIILLKGMFGPDDPRYLKVSKLRDQCNATYIANASKLSQEDKANMVSSIDYEKLLDSLRPKALVMMKETKPTKSDITTVQDYIMLSIYYSFALRCNVANMDIHIGTKMPTETKRNYIWSNGKIVRIILNQYKTSATYGQEVISDLDKELNNDLLQYCEFRKRIGNMTAFTNKRGKGMSDNLVSKVFRSLFMAHLGKQFTITMNRNRVVSEDEDVANYIKSKQAVESKVKQMGTSVKMATEVYNKSNMPEDDE